MYTLDENDGLNGYDGLNSGLNKGFNLKKFVKKNVRLRNVNLKNAVAVGTIASSFIPAGAVAGKLAKLGKVGKLATKAQKLMKTKVGSLVMSKVKQGIALSKNDKKVVQQIAVAQDQDVNTPNVLTKQQFDQATANQPNVVQANAPLVKDTSPLAPQLTPAQAQTIAEVKGVDPEVTNTPTKEQIETISNLKDIPEENLKEEVKNQLENTPVNTSKEVTKSSINPLYVGAGLLLGGGLIYAISK